MMEDQKTLSPFMDKGCRKKCKERRAGKVALRFHYGTYLIVNGFLVLIWALTGGGYPWFLWAVVGWWIGLAMHAFPYFSFSFAR